MPKALRTPERLFNFALWIVAFVFAGFLIGFGSLVVRDLPRVENGVTRDDFIDAPRAAQLERDNKERERQSREVGERAQREVLVAQSATASYRAARQQFDNWIRTRETTRRAEQDAELLTRTRELDDLKARERAAEVAVERAQAEQLQLQQAIDATERARNEILSGGQERYEQALRTQELRVFGIRLAVTLPLIAIAAWLFVKQRRSRWWPFVWGFVLFAAFTFFVELVPYLPSYGGYVRYAVGIALTVFIGRYVVVGMQRYLERQRAAEARSEVERRRALSYEHAVKSTNAGICPGCERSFKVHDGTSTNFCMHCGMTLFDHCGACNTRKNAFFPFCPQCGVGRAANAVTNAPATGAAPA